MSWKKVRLGEIVKVSTGKYDVNHSVENGLYPFYTCALEPFRSNTFSFDDEVIILPGNGANVGQVMYYNGKFEAYQRTYVLHEVKGYVKYIYYFLKGNWNRIQQNKQYGSATNYIRLDNITDLQIPLPPLSVQKRIAEILDAADALRRKDQEMLNKYDELAQSIFIELFGDPVKNEKGWEVKRLDDLLLEGEKISYGVVQPGDDFPNGVPIVRVGDFNLMRIDKTNLKRINPEIEKNYNRTRLKGDEILIACVGSIGKIALADDSLQGFNIVRATAKVRVDKERINRKYLAFHLSQKSIQNYFIAETRTSSQPTLNIKQIEETKILIPPIEIQNHFDLLSDDLLKQIEMIHQSNSNGLFQSLLQQAFKGELVQ
jgi:type I restriction enzyme S subunit